LLPGVEASPLAAAPSHSRMRPPGLTLADALLILGRPGFSLGPSMPAERRRHSVSSASSTHRSLPAEVVGWPLPPSR
jgi:hypothetical protein